MILDNFGSSSATLFRCNSQSYFFLYVSYFSTPDSRSAWRGNKNRGGGITYPFVLSGLPPELLLTRFRRLLLFWLLLFPPPRPFPWPPRRRYASLDEIFVCTQRIHFPRRCIPVLLCIRLIFSPDLQIVRFCTHWWKVNIQSFFTVRKSPFPGSCPDCESLTCALSFSLCQYLRQRSRISVYSERSVLSFVIFD